MAFKSINPRVLALSFALSLAYPAFAQALPSSDGQITECAAPQTYQGLTLGQVVEHVFCRNPQVRSLWAQVQTGQAQLGVAQAPFYPQVQLTGSNTRTYTQANKELGTTQGSVNLGVSYLLYDFGGRDASETAARKTLEALQATQDAQLQSLAMSAVQAFYALQSAQDSVTAAVASEASALYALDVARARFNAGTTIKADELQAQAAYAQAKLVTLQAKGDVSLKRGALANLMHLSSNSSISVQGGDARTPDSAQSAAIESLTSKALTSRPDLLAARRQEEAAYANIDSVKATGLPSISVNASTSPSYSSTSVQQPTVSTMGVTITVPIFTGYQVTHAVEAAKAKAQQATASREQLEDQADLGIWQAWQALQTNAAAIDVSKNYVEAARAYQEVAKGRYKAGVGTLADLLTAQADTAKAEQTHIANQYALSVSRFSLSLALGALRNDLLTP